MSTEMEMPVVCDCGELFDLNDGYTTKKYGSNKVICDKCHKKELNFIRIKNEIEEIEMYSTNKRKTAKLYKELEETGFDKDDYYFD